MWLAYTYMPLWWGGCCIIYAQNLHVICSSDNIVVLCLWCCWGSCSVCLCRKVLLPSLCSSWDLLNVLHVLQSSSWCVFQGRLIDTTYHLPVMVLTPERYENMPIQSIKLDGRIFRLHQRPWLPGVEGLCAMVWFKRSFKSGYGPELLSYLAVKNKNCIKGGDMTNSKFFPGITIWQYPFWGFMCVI